MSNDPFDTNAIENYRRRPRWLRGWPRLRGRSLIYLVIAVVAGCGIWFAFGWLAHGGDVVVHIYGEGVDRLEPEALVTVGTHVVGSVRGIELREGRVYADLKINAREARGIPTNSRFSVESLRYWFPGERGVRIKLPQGSAFLEAIPDGFVARTDDHHLPADVPRGFYLLVGAGVVVLVIVLVVAGVLRDWMRAFGTLVTGVLLIAGLYLYLSGQISPP